MLRFAHGLMAPKMRSVYETSYAQAAQAYRGSAGTDPHSVAMTVIEGMFGEGGRRRKLPSLDRLPEAVGLVWLGQLLEIHTADDRGNLLVHKWKPQTGAFWCYDLQAVVWIEGLFLSAPQYRAELFPDLLELYRTWHDGKDPVGVAVRRLPRPKLGKAQVCVATCYRSDKFSNTGKMDNYIHYHDSHVLAYLGKKAGMVQGGRLELTKHGLVH